MWFGVPKEGGEGPQADEKRVGLTPAGIRDLVEEGAQVVIESGAGGAAGFSDDEYRSVGAHVVYSHEEVFGRAEMVVKIGRPSMREMELMQPECAILAFWHLAAATNAYLAQIASHDLTVIGCEIIQEDDGSLPVLKISSEITGKMAPQIAGRLLESGSGGAGILLGGAPGIPPADVVILGGGNLGFHASRAFLGLGCSVYVLDIDHSKLEAVDRHLSGQVITAHATHENVEKFTAFADVLVGAVLVTGEVAPLVVTRSMVQRMRSGSVILDFSFDQGGCVETTRLQGPAGGVFVRDGILHFAIPNCPSLVARTSSQALTYSLLPFLETIQRRGLRETLLLRSDLRRGCYGYRGRLVSSHITKEPADITRLLVEG